MKNAADWRPTKFAIVGNRLRPSRDARQVAPGSRFVGQILAARYENLLKHHARGRLLDLGAGSAPLYGVYRELVTDVTCLDWRQSAHSALHIDIEADLESPLPLANGSYDTVLLTDVLEHVYRPHQLVQEIARVLASRGKLLLGAPFFYWVHEAPHDYGRYTRFMLRRLCAESGLVVESIEETGGSFESAWDMLGKHLSWSSVLGGVHAIVGHGLLALPGMTAFSRYSARWFPQGYILVASKP